MHCALRRANSDFQKGAYSGRDSLSSKEQSSLITSIEYFLQDFELPNVTWRNSDSGCAVVKFLSLEPDGHRRIVALPLQYTDQINMESLHLSHLPPVSPFKFNRQNVQKGPPLDVVYSVKSFTNRRFTDSSKRHQSRNKALVNKAIKWNVSRKCQKPLISGDSSAIIPHDSNAIRSSDIVSCSKVDSIIKRSSRKKSRKKGKQSKKVLCNIHSTDPDVICEEYGNTSSASETVGNNEGDGPTLSSAASEFLWLDPKNFETAWTVTSSNDELAIVSNLESQIVLTDYSEMQDSFILDSISTGSIGDGSMNLGNDENRADKEINNTDVSEPQNSGSRNVYYTRQSSLNGFANTYNHTDRDRQSTHCCSSSGTEMKYVVPNKRSRQNKVGPRSANVPKSGCIGNMRTGKANIHSVWQKVQKKDVNDRADEFTTANVVDTRLDLPLREAPIINATCKDVNVDIVSKRENRKQQNHKVSKKLKRKNVPASKREYTCYSRKGSHASLAGSDGSLKLRVDQSDIPDIITQSEDKERLNLVSTSCSQPSCQTDGFQTSKVECMKSEEVHSIQLCPNEIDHRKNVCRTASGMHDQNVGNEDETTLKTCEYWKEPNLRQMQSPLYDAASREIQKHISLGDSSKQKWIPIGMKDSEVASSTESENSSLEHSDEGGSKIWTVKDTIRSNVVSEAAVESMTPETCSSDGRLPISDAVEEMTSKQLDASNVVNSSYVSGVLNSYEACSNRILEAVNDSCRAQLASENVQMITGHPIAEFERVLYCSSPVIHQSPSCINCRACNSQTPDITLGCIWEWYEKNGCYGMEIRGGDLGYSQRSGADCFAFRAYFVPYLSGIQLFKNDRSSDAGDMNNGLYSDEVLETCWSGEGDAVNLALVDELAVPEVRSSDAKDFSDLQLLFEYFEYERPQHRRPLYEKIKELVKNDGNSHSKVYGDPTILDSINLHNLHPRSWYSVAWYPIYRIPDGNFCASFLTYHSLGCLVRRRTNLESHSMHDSIVSPVVGLQSYNAQRECWFQLRPSEMEQTVVTNLNPCGVLEERLRTLEETASLMARAVVSKGDESSVNRHPDYEFFLSRRYY